MCIGVSQYVKILQPATVSPSTRQLPINWQPSQSTVASLRFITNWKLWHLTHHNEFYCQVRWPPLATLRLAHWYTFIYKVILGLLPQCLCVLITQKSVEQYSLRSQDFAMLSVPNAQTEIEKRAFRYSAPSAWTLLQNGLKLKELVSLKAFISKMKALEADSIRCRCF